MPDSPVGTAGFHFGKSLALDGDWLAVGSDVRVSSTELIFGAVYLFHRNEGGANQWGFVRRIEYARPIIGHAHYSSLDGDFGDEVDLDNGLLAVSAPRELVASIDRIGAVYLYAGDQDGPGQWGQVAKLTSDDDTCDQFATGINLEGDRLVVANPLSRVPPIIHANNGYLRTYSRHQGGTDQWGEENAVPFHLQYFLSGQIAMRYGWVAVGDPGVFLNQANDGAVAVLELGRGSRVTTTNDTVNAGDGLTSLREAVTQANLGSKIDRAVFLPEGTYFLGRPGIEENANATGDLDVTNTTNTVTLHGFDARNTVIDANGIDRLLHVQAGASLNLRGLTLTGGRAPNGAFNADGKYGGGILNAGVLTLKDCTLHGNRAGNEAGAETLTGGVDGDGGGLFITTTSGAMVRQSTFTQNRAGDATGGVKGYGGGICVVNSSIALSNTILAGNSGGVGAVNGFGTFASPAHNLLGTAAGITMTGAPTGNITNVSAQLGSLQDNGGPTDTCLPGATSPAIDAGSSAVGDAVFSDQRGVTRLAPNAPMDIGAVETTDDFDGDGLPDGFEIANGLNYQEPADAGVDYDGDTVINLDERTTGTDPNDAASVFRVTATAIPGGAEIRFPSLSGRRYTLQRSTTGPAGPFANVPSAVNIPGTGGTLVIPQTPNLSTAFYQVRVSLDP